jgi:hypothetical protein
MSRRDSLGGPPEPGVWVRTEQLLVDEPTLETLFALTVPLPGYDVNHEERRRVLAAQVITSVLMRDSTFRVNVVNSGGIKHVLVWFYAQGSLVRTSPPPARGSQRDAEDPKGLKPPRERRELRTRDTHELSVLLWWSRRRLPCSNARRLS